MLNSPVDIAIIAGTLLILFGPKKLPELGKALGQGIGLFKKGLHEAQEEIKTSMHTEAAGPATTAVVADQYGQVAPMPPSPVSDKPVSRETIIKE